MQRLLCGVQGTFALETATRRPGPVLTSCVLSGPDRMSPKRCTADTHRSPSPDYSVAFRWGTHLFPFLPQQQAHARATMDQEFATLPVWPVPRPFSKAQALSKTEEGRDKIQSLVAAADSELKRQLCSSIKQYQGRIWALSRYRDDLFRRYLSRYPKERSSFEKDVRSAIADPQRVVIVDQGLFVSFMPDEHARTGRTEHAASSQATSQAASQAAPQAASPAQNTTSRWPAGPMVTSTSPVSNTPPPSTSNPASFTTPVPRNPQEDSTALEPALQPSFTTYYQTPGLTRQPPIKTRKLSARGSSQYWVFEYVLKGHLGLFILQCPNKTCPSPTFTTDPIANECATSHFRRCGVSFKTESDLIRRYARQGEQGLLPPSSSKPHHLPPAKISTHARWLRTSRSQPRRAGGHE